MHPHYRGVAFLLSLGTIPIACGKDDPSDTTETGNGPTNPMTDPGVTTGTPSGTDATSDTAPPTTSGPTSVDGTTADPDPDTSSPNTTFLTNNETTEGSDETGPIEPPPPSNPACIAYLAHLEECMPGYRYNPEAAAYCDLFLNYGMQVDGPACADAIEAVFACINAAPCDATPEENCPDQIAAAGAACPTLFMPPETTTDSDSGSDSGSTG